MFFVQDEKKSIERIGLIFVYVCQVINVESQNSHLLLSSEMLFVAVDFYKKNIFFVFSLSLFFFPFSYIQIITKKKTMVETIQCSLVFTD